MEGAEAQQGGCTVRNGMGDQRVSHCSQGAKGCKAA